LEDQEKRIEEIDGLEKIGERSGSREKV